jgi:hypothetical protein
MNYAGDSAILQKITVLPELRQRACARNWNLDDWGGINFQRRGRVAGATNEQNELRLIFDI